MSTGWKLCAAALVVPLLLPVVASAQERTEEPEFRPMYELPAIAVFVPSEEDPLAESAAELYQTGAWAEAGMMYQEAAEELPENDPGSYALYDMAGRLYFYAGEFTEGREMMERAAAVAEATGDVLSAAYRHVDAAFIAVWEGYPGMRREHVATAEEYADTEGFDHAHVERIFALTRGVGQLPMRD